LPIDLHQPPVTPKIVSVDSPVAMHLAVILVYPTGADEPRSARHKAPEIVVDHLLGLDVVASGQV